MKAWRSLILVGVLLLLPAKHFSQISGQTPTPGPQPLIVTVRPWGPDQAAIDAAKAMVVAHPSVRRYLDRTRNRLLSFELLDSAREGQPPTDFRATFYDYTNNRAVIATGTFSVPESVSAITLNTQPQPSGEEFEAALVIVRSDPYFGPLLAGKTMTTYRPMPPVIEPQVGLGTDRIVTVGLLSRRAPAVPSEVIGVNMITSAVVRFPNGAPATSLATAAACGIPSAGQGTTPRGTAGQYQLIVTQGGTTLWSMLITRPSVSSGLRGSAIDLQNIEYLGKRVLKHANVPVLNVQYVGNACGPYRDWQWQEGQFVANGTDVAPGIRACTSAPQTIMENGTDTGNFAGVAYYVTSTSVILSTELEAGWYRYVNEWTFDANGTMHPRFMFGATTSSCVCNTHTHHAYFRFDFDIGGPDKNVVSEVNGRWFPIRRSTELASPRSPTWNRRWIIENESTGNKYAVVPRPIDGLTDVYGRGDVWVLRYHAGAEMDDGHNTTGGNTEIDLAQFLNGESIDRADSVFWYGTHSTHIGGDEDTDSVGPDLVPVSW